MKKALLIIIFLIGFSSLTNAQSTLALQEKCAEGAKKYFSSKLQSYGIDQVFLDGSSFSDEKGFGNISFQSHYSKKNNQCYIRIDYDYFKFGNTPDKRSIDIYNVFENTNVAFVSETIHKNQKG